MAPPPSARRRDWHVAPLAALGLDLPAQVRELARRRERDAERSAGLIVEQHANRRQHARAAAALRGGDRHLDRLGRIGRHAHCGQDSDERRRLGAPLDTEPVAIAELDAAQLREQREPFIHAVPRATRARSRAPTRGRPAWRRRSHGRRGTADARAVAACRLARRCSAPPSPSGQSTSISAGACTRNRPARAPARCGTRCSRRSASNCAT